jgi:hypothetical protein
MQRLNGMPHAGISLKIITWIILEILDNFLCSCGNYKAMKHHQLLPEVSNAFIFAFGKSYIDQRPVSTVSTNCVEDDFEVFKSTLYSFQFIVCNFVYSFFFFLFGFEFGLSFFF